MSDIDLSVIIPCYKEEPHLRESLRVLSATLDATRYSYELILVDDCSPDGTRGVIESICREYPKARYIFHNVNKGRGGAFKTGYREAKGRVAGFLDIDLEVGAHYIPPLVRYILEEGCDVATGDRHYLLEQTHGWVRHFFSKGYHALCAFFLNFGVRDSETGIKFFSREACRDAVLGSESDDWFWDTEVMARAALSNLKIIEMPVLFLRRYDKESTVRVLPDTWRYLLAFISFRRKVGLGMADRSPIYWTGVGYDLFMRVLCGAENDRTLARVGAMIPAKSTVSDLCCGTARLYRDFLKGKECGYLGLDANGHFIMSLKRKGIPSKLHNTLTDPIPPADYVVMCNSFYHFHDRKEEILAKLRAAAGKAVILSEPVRNMSSHDVGPVARFSNWLTNPGVGDYTRRFTPETFRRFAEEGGASQYHYEKGDRNAIAVFKSPN